MFTYKYYFFLIQKYEIMILTLLEKKNRIPEDPLHRNVYTIHMQFYYGIFCIQKFNP